MNSMKVKQQTINEEFLNSTTELDRIRYFFNPLGSKEPIKVGNWLTTSDVLLKWVTQT